MSDLIIRSVVALLVVALVVVLCERMVSSRRGRADHEEPAPGKKPEADEGP